MSTARRARWAGSLISSPWMVMDVMEHHRFSGDTAFLRKRGWPILKESCEFVQSWLVLDHKTDKRVPRAGCSHEIGFGYTDKEGKQQFSEIGPVTAYDQSIIWQVMSDTLEAAAILSRLGGPLALRYDSKTRTFPSKKGEQILFTPSN